MGFKNKNANIKANLCLLGGPSFFEPLDSIRRRVQISCKRDVFNVVVACNNWIEINIIISF